GETNVIKTKSVVPPRGGIFDRRGNILVSNQPMFSMQVTPRDFSPSDTMYLLKYLELNPGEITQAWHKAEAYSRYKESTLARHIEPEDYGKLQEEMWHLNGVSFTVDNKRYYPHAVGANLLGYISEVGPVEIKQSKEEGLEENGGFYVAGDQVGKSGIESYYEDTLRGVKGYRKVLHDKHNREVGPYAGGRYDKPAIRGKDIMLGIDVELQAFGEKLLQNKKGSIVALDPKTGEILAFVSAPNYDPNVLTGRELRKNWRRLRGDTLNPLYNRPLMARYPPGSIFKIPMSLVALQEGVLNVDTRYGCGGGWYRLGGKPGCHAHASPLSLINAIRYSCNAYFAETYFNLLHHKQYESFYEGYETWYKYMDQFGFGRNLGVDIPYEVRGLIPSASRYDKWYGQNRWVAKTIISNSIGQGEILLTPLQMANMVAIVANRGFYKTPHFVRAVRDEASLDWRALSYRPEWTKIERRHFEPVIEAMQMVVESGTARRAFLKDIEVCGKTGTVENPHGEDHSVFVAFAPKDKPDIALAVIIENGGFGGTWAAPTAACMIEKYIHGEVREKKWELQRLLNANFIDL
ncbi:MAG: penicillin-binding protein 2, partial [Bacteroidota bacterium]